jgi:CIC family chloride channel protein
MGGALVGFIGIGLPHVFGVGYEAINEALNGTLVWQFMLLLVVAKILAVAITIGSGGSGGIFAPSLFIGAMLGGAVGTVVHSVWPVATAGTGAYALVGMGAVVAAGTHAPITAILIIFELTGEYRIILPLMISCIIATLLATRLQRSSIYTLKLLRRGIDIHRGRAVNVLQHLEGAEAMRSDIVTVRPEEGLVPLISKFIDHRGSTLFVTDDDGTFRGIITGQEIRPIMQDPAGFEALIIAEDIAVQGEYPQLSPQDSLADVMRFLGGYRGEIPVLEDGKLAGVIWPEDVIERYNTEVFKRDMAGSMVASVQPERHMEPIPAAGNTVVAEVSVPGHFVGKSIGELNIRQDFGVSVLMIKHTSGMAEELTTTPTADYVFKPGDVILAFGTSDRVRSLQYRTPRAPRPSRG